MSVINTETLMASGRELLLPATLEICLHNHASDSVQTLELLQIFRVVPKRRIVALARWQGQRVVVKLFFARPRWAQHLEREVQGITAMQSVGMATATLLGHGELRDGHGGFVLLRYIEGGKNLSQCWQQASADDREAMLRRVLALIADCHERGLLQKDIHLNNFMLREEEIFLLDAGELEQFSQQPEGVDGVNSLRNLALFLAQFPVSNDERVPALYEEYRRQRPGLGLSEDIAVFRALLRKKRSLRLRTVLKKLYRETSANAFRRDWNHYIVYERALESADLQRFLQAPDRYIDEGVLIKGGRTATVAKVMIDGKPYVLKRYNIKSFWHRIRRLFQPSRAWVCWRNAHMLEMLGIENQKSELKVGKKRELLIKCADYHDPRVIEAVLGNLEDFDEGCRYGAAEVLIAQDETPVVRQALLAALANPEEESNRFRVRIAEVVSSRGWDLGEHAEAIAGRPPIGFGVEGGKLVRG